MNTFPLEIITQEKVLLKENVESLYVSTIDGDITVLAHHMPYVSVLKPAEIIITRSGEKIPFACTGGVLEVTPEKVVVLADSAVRSDEIDEAEALRVKEEAERAMEGKLEDRERAITMAALEKALLHLNVARKRKPRS